MSRSIVLFSTIFLFLFGFIFYCYGFLDANNLRYFEEWIPVDSIQYVERSENLILDDLTIGEIASGALNWLSLSFIYKKLNDLNGFAALDFVFINSLCFYIMVRFGAFSGISNDQFINNYHSYTLLMLISSPYLLPWILVPNKELIMGAGIVVAMHLIERSQKLALVILAVIFGLIKIQFFLATVLFFISRNLPWRKSTVLLIFSLLYPWIYEVVPGLHMSHFLEVNINEIRSANIFLAIDTLSSYPLGYIPIFYARLFFNLLGGLYPARILDGGFSMGTLAPLSSFILGLLVVMSIYKMIKNQSIPSLFNSTSDKFYFIFCVLLINLTLPFMQPRYYWWMTPILLSYLLFSSNKRYLHSSPS